MHLLIKLLKDLSFHAAIKAKLQYAGFVCRTIDNFKADEQDRGERETKQKAEDLKYNKSKPVDDADGTEIDADELYFGKESFDEKWGTCQSGKC